MQAISSTYARNEWSSVIDSALREKPTFIKRTRDLLVLADAQDLYSMLEAYRFTATLYQEDDGSTTISLDRLDLAENGATQQDAVEKLSAAILEYSEDFYDDYAYWARGDRKTHIPYVLKALLLNDISKIGGAIECRLGEI